MPWVSILVLPLRLEDDGRTRVAIGEPKHPHTGIGRNHLAQRVDDARFDGYRVIDAAFAVVSLKGEGSLCEQSIYGSLDLGKGNLDGLTFYNISAPQPTDGKALGIVGAYLVFLASSAMEYVSSSNLTHRSHPPVRVKN